MRTFGCQMNEHDSERIAGLLESDGMTRAEDDADADVVVLNTCCIRENAKNYLHDHPELMVDMEQKIRAQAGLNGEEEVVEFSEKDEAPIELD